MNNLIPRSSQSNVRVFSSCLLSFLLFMTPLATLAASARPSVAPDSSQSSKADKDRQASSQGFFNRLPQAADGAVAQAQRSNSARRGFFASLMPAVPVVTATKVDAISDTIADGGNNDGNLDPGEKITYTVTITDAVADAADVVFNDTVHAHTSYVAGSLNVSPLAGNDSYDTIANTLLEVGPVGSPSTRPKVTVAGSVFDNDREFLSDTFTLKSVGGTNYVSGTATGTSTNGGTVVMDGTGKFSFTPKEGSTANDTFDYTITDDGPDNVAGNSDDLTSTATVTINILGPRIWYVDNTFAGVSKGRSTDPFNTLSAAQTAANAAGDYIYVFTGSGTTGQSLGFTFQANNQRLLGEGVQLDVPVSVNGGPNPTVLRNAGAKPSITNTGGNGVTATDKSGIIIRGLTIGGNTNAIAVTITIASGGATISDNTITGGSANAIDVTTTATTIGGGSVTITNNTISGAGTEGIDINASGTGTLTADVQNNALTATGNAFDARTTAGTLNLNLVNHSGIVSGGNGIDISGLSGGTLNVTGFANNSVAGSTGVNGISLNTVKFDSVPGGGIDAIAAGTTTIGAAGAGNGVGGNGLVLINTTGTLPFTDLDIWADGGNGLDVTGINAATTGITVGAGVGTITASNGTAVQVTGATINLQLSSISSSNGVNGVSLTNGVDGTFSAGASSSITNASGDDFVIGSGTANITYNGPISNSGAGNSVDVTGHTGGTVAFSNTINDTGQGIFLNSNTGTTINFTGVLTLNTATNAAFTATGAGPAATSGGTVTATATTNTITTTTGVGLNVAHTTIGSGGLKFKSITVGTAGGGPSTSGIILNNTGTSGSLVVSGNGTNTLGGDDSGGIIQRATQYGISLTSTLSPSFTNVNIHDIGRNGIDGFKVTNFTFANGKISTCGTASIAGDFEVNNIAFVDRSGANDNTIDGTVSITNSTITEPERNAIYIETWAGTISNLNISNNTISGGTTNARILNAIGVFSQGSATGTASITTGTIQNNNISDFRFFDTAPAIDVWIGGNGIRLVGGNANAASTSATLGAAGTPIVISGNDIDNVGSNMIATTFSGKQGTSNLTIQNNGTNADKMTNAEGNGISVFFGGNGTFNALVDNNYIDNIDQGANPSGSKGIAVQSDFGLTQNVDVTNSNITVSNNVVSNTAGDGIQATGINNAGTFNVRIVNNNVTTVPDLDARYGIRVQQSNSGTQPTLNLEINGNTTQGAFNAFHVLGNGIGVRKQDPYQFGIEGLSPTPTNSPEAYINGQNPSGHGTDKLAGTGFIAQNVAYYRQETDQLQYTAQADGQLQSGDGFIKSLLAVLNVKPASAPLPSDNVQTAHAASVKTQAAAAKPSQAMAEGNFLETTLAFMKQDSRTIQVSADHADSGSVQVSDNSVALAHASSRQPAQGRLSAGKDHTSATQPSRGAKSAAHSAAPTFMPSGETLSATTIGALKVGQSVTIKFQVTLDTPPNLDAADLVGGPHVRNQGKVSGSNFTLVNGVSTSSPNTDDTAVGGASDPTDTPVDLYDATVSVVTSKPGPTFMVEGEAVTFTATVAPVPSQLGAPGSLTGSVTFYDGAAIPANIISGCSNVTLNSGTADCTTTALTSAGSPHTINAVYSGDGNFGTNTGSVSQTVNACTSNPVVTSIADDGSVGTLRHAILTACVGSTITFDTAGVFSTPQTITLTTGELLVTKNLTIDGPDSAANRVTINGNNASRVFHIQPGKTVTLRELTVTGGFASGSFPADSGGGILNELGTLTLNNMTLSSNTATFGGGVYNYGNGGTASLTINNSTISGNHTVTHGAGIYDDGINGGTATLTINNSTISGNGANGQGGGILVVGGVSTIVTTTNVTVTNNTSDFDDTNVTDNGGGLFVGSGPIVRLRNTIIAGNFRRSSGPVADDISGANVDTTANSSNNLIGTGGTGGLTATNGNLINVVNPGLGTLASNGGLTQTHNLLFGSPAIEAGSNTFSDAVSLTTDQRGTGFARKADSADSGTTQTVDIGAFEVQPTIGNIPDKPDGLEDVSIVSYPFDVGDATIGIDSITTNVSSDPAGVIQSVTVNNATTATPNLSIAYVANKFGVATINVTVNKTINGQLLTMSDSFDLTVSPVADVPSVTNVTTNEDTQTTSGLVITKNAVDGVEVTHFKITNITNGTLFKNDGVTPINNNDFITEAEGNAGLKFTPTANSSASGSFQVQGAVGNTGGGLSTAATATITVNAIADTPSVTNATTNEDTQTTSGLVISRNAADGAEVTHFKITGITNGTLFQNNGTTQINNGDFITFAQGNAGLKFTPTANFSGNGQFTIQASTTGADSGLGGSTVNATITVNPVADTPSVTNATTTEDTQTTSGLVISRNAVDGAEVTHFKITNIQNGTLFKNDGTTPINNNDFITFAEGNAGLKFTPALNFSGAGIFQVQGATSAAGAGLSAGAATATITVGSTADVPTVTNATTNEDAQTSSGLVITRNAADGVEVTHFKITSITNGTLFKNDGTTAISSGSFITAAEGNAGLKFTPTANFSGDGSFQVQAALDSAGTGLSTFATATITVTPIADTPTVTDATTAINTQTTSGLVISRNAVDGSEVTHFKITGITNGTLFKNDGTTQINNGDFITFAEGNAGLRFTPDLNKSTSNGDTFSFQVQAATDGAGAGLSTGFATASITVDCQSGLIVTSLLDDGSVGTLRHAISFSCPGSTITFNLAAGTHTIALDSNLGQLIINKNLTINGPTGAANRVTVSGGGSIRVLQINGAVTVNISDLTISNGQVSGANNGSGINNNGGTLTLTNSTVSGNSSTGSGFGGGIYSENGTLNITSSTVSGNSVSGAGGQGGGVASVNNTLNITNSTVSGNTASGAGNRAGGIYHNVGTLTITNSTISGNSATGFNSDGGGVWTGTTANIINSTISGNSAVDEGGGIYSGGTLTVTNSTITNNTADSDNNTAGTKGGGIHNNGGTVTLHNTIVAGNLDEGGATDTASDISGTADAASSFNLIGDAATSGGLTNGTNGNIVGNAGVGTINARLGALANNGGATMTHALLAGSPALDAGSNTISDGAGLTTDQRGTGFGRKRDAASDADTTQTVDIGAFEADPSVEDITDKATAEDTALPSFVFRVGDSTSSFDSITATSGNTTLVPNANITVGADTASTRTLSITPAANQSGTAAITVTVTKTINSTAVSMSDTFVLTVGTVPDTPSVTNATTNEDTQTTSGLVISRNAADGAEVTHFKITNITGGTLFKNDGVTPINNNDFITFAEGNAGLKFTPAANSFAGGSFQVQASTDAVGTSLSAGAATAVITVNAVADTPSVTNATTNEDTQTTSGLVISRNAADGAEVTHFKISGITNGTLFKNNGTTQINNGDVITFAEGNAGLKFTPAANLFSPSTTFSFQVQGATSAAGAGLSSGFATATITVNTVADTPNVTNATTLEDQQSTSGLVITRNAADGAEVTHFRITGITGGTLFKNNGTTQINNNDFITVAEGNAGLKFTPTTNSNTSGQFQVQSSLNNTVGGLGGGLATATITITPINDAPTLDAIGNLNINEDAGLQTVNLTGISAGGGESQTLVITATSDNTGVVPNPTVNYTSPNATGSLSFTPVLNQGGSALITVTVNDGGGTANGGVETVVRTFTVTVNAVNDAPVNTIPGPQSVTKNGSMTFSAANSNQVSIADVDAGSNTVQVTLTATNGKMTLAGTTGLTFVPANANNDGTGDASLNFTGTIANINNALSGLVFEPTNGYDGPASIQITTNDLGNTGSGGALSDTDTINITVHKGGVLAFSSATYAVAEDAGSITITVVRTDGDTGTTKVDYTTSNGTAIAGVGQDYTTSSGQLTFNNGETSKTFTVAINNDSLDEANETINLTLSNVTGSGALGIPSTAVLTINDNDPPPSLSINDVTVTEGNSGTTNATFTVTLSAVSGQTATVNYQTADGTATIANNDYQAVPSTLLTFNPGETTKNVTVVVNGDPDAEPNETFTVNLSGETNATISDGQGVGTINSDDTPVMQFSQSIYNVNEDALFITVTVNRLGDNSQPATINYTTNDQAGLNPCNLFNGIASPRCDYAYSVGKLHFAAGQGSRDIIIPIVNDVYVEGPETFTLTLSNPSDGELGTPSSTTITINDNDSGAAANPIDNSEFFIRQLYIDFLGRLPDQAGLAAWLNILNNCPVNDVSCDRVAVAAGFAQSDEFANRGYFIYRFYRAGLGRIPHYAEFIPDMARVSGFLSAQDLEAAKVDFINDFMARPEFTNRYGGTDNAAYVNLLEQTALVTLPNKQQLINDLTNGTKTRAQVLRIAMETTETYSKYYNEAFIVMNYFGFLRRDPDAAFQAWIDLFNNTNNPRLIINGFANSLEYRQRFGN
ncbi:MAG TPA: Calx-beta domain-containing protein [Pyrinomonadaceae bacterium]|nr:Calx-beta domain-containing protein [Pyrinomonadaceae bacterium]